MSTLWSRLARLLSLVVLAIFAWAGAAATVRAGVSLTDGSPSLLTGDSTGAAFVLNTSTEVTAQVDIGSEPLAVVSASGGSGIQLMGQLLNGPITPVGGPIVPAAGPIVPTGGPIVAGQYPYLHPVWGPDPIAGDVNLDGVVDFSDYVIIQSDFGMHPATRQQGDLNGDGFVDFSDFLILQAHFGDYLVPEPGSLIMWGLILGGVLVARFAKRRIQMRSALAATNTL